MRYNFCSLKKERREKVWEIKTISLFICFPHIYLDLEMYASIFQTFQDAVEM